MTFSESEKPVQGSIIRPALIETFDPETATSAELLSGVRALALADARYWFYVAMVLGIAKITDGLLNAFLSSRLVPGHLTSGVFLRGFPSKTLDRHARIIH